MGRKMRYLAMAALIGVGSGCVDPPPHVILTVRDDGNLAVDAESLVLGRERDGEVRTVPLDGRSFPMTLTVDGFAAGEVVLLWVDARRGKETLASGRVRLEFPENRSGNATVNLAAPCSDEPSLGCALPDGSDAESSGRGVCLNGRCGESFCGDGVINSQIDPDTGEPFETCDDGNEDTQDGCPDGPTGTCELARCGDGFLYSRVDCAGADCPPGLESTEPCDDGNDDNEDSCRSIVEAGVRRCVINVCGDGVVNRERGEDGRPFEECDDGNEIDEDACRIVVDEDRVSCIANVCGDGIVNASVDPNTGAPIEQCDDHNDNPNDACNSCSRPNWTARVLIGEGDNVGLPTLRGGDPGSLSLDLIGGVTTGPDGELYVADQDGNLIWLLDQERERITRIAGSGIETGFPSGPDTDFGSGGDALRATIRPRGLDTDGRFLYFANFTNQPPSFFNATALHGVFQVNLATGRIDLIAGRPQDAFDQNDPNFAGDGGPAVAALLHTPSDVAVDSEQNVFIADTRNYRVRVIVDGQIYTVAGTGTCAEIIPTTLNATAADLCWVRGVEIGPEHSSGVRTIYLSEEEPPTPAEDAPDACDDGQRDTGAGDRVWALTGTIAELVAGNGTLELIAGTGFDGFCDGTLGDDIAAVNSTLSAPYGLAFDGQDSEGVPVLYIGDLDHHRVRRVDLQSGVITTVAGTGTRGRAIGNRATSSQLDRPRAVAVHGNRLTIGEIDERLLSVDLQADTLQVLTGVPSNETLNGLDARALLLDRPRGVDFDSNGDLYLVEQNYARILGVRSQDGTYPPSEVEVVAGSGGFSFFVQGFGGDGGPAANAELNQPHDVTVFEDEAGNRTLFIADTANHRIRRVSANGTIASVAGSGPGEDPFEIGELVIVPDVTFPIPATARGAYEPTDEGQPAAGAVLNLPTQVEAAPSPEDPNVPEVYFADFGNQRIRRVNAAGAIETVAGDGDEQYDGPNGPSIGRVGGIAFAAGRLYFVASTNDGAPRFSLWRYDPGNDTVEELRVLELESGLRLAGLAASTSRGFLELFVSVDDDDDIEDERVLRIRPGANDGGGTIELFAGYLGRTLPGAQEPPQVTVDGVPATQSRFFSPTYLAVDRNGNLAISDPTRLRVRGVERASGVIDTLVGRAFPGDGTGETARLGAPAALLYDGGNRWLVADNLGQPVLFPFVATLREVTLGTEAASTSLRTLVGQQNGYKLSFFGAVLGERTMAATWQEAFREIGGLAHNPADGSVYFTDPVQHYLYRLSRPSDTPSDWTLEFYTGYNVATTVAFPAGSASGPLDDATFTAPTGLAFDSANQLLYVADTGNHTIRVIDLALETVSDALVGVAGQAGFAGDDLPGAFAEVQFNRPTHLALACDGSLYVSDEGNRRVRRIDFATSTVTTVLGNGLRDNSGQFGPARSLPVSRPGTLTVDRYGNLFVASEDTVRVVSAGTDAGCADGALVATGDDIAYSVFGAPPRVEYPETVARCVDSVAADPTRDDRVFLQDSCQGLFVELTR